MQMHFAIFFHVETRAGFQIGQIFGVGQFHAKNLLCPGELLLLRPDQIDPDRLNPRQIFFGFYGNLPQPAFVQIEHPDHHVSATGFNLNNQFCAHKIRHFPADFLFTFITDQLPDDLPVVRR